MKSVTLVNKIEKLLENEYDNKNIQKFNDNKKNGEYTIIGTFALILITDYKELQISFYVETPPDISALFIQDLISMRSGFYINIQMCYRFNENNELIFIGDDDNLENKINIPEGMCFETSKESKMWN